MHSGDQDYVDPDFVGIQQAEAETGYSITTGKYNHNSNDASEESEDHFPPQSQLPEDQQSPTIGEIESIFMSLIQQGFLRGFISRPHHAIGSTAATVSAGARFAIPGSKARGGPVNAGFPGIYSTILANSDDEGMVPGWVREENLGGGGGHIRATSGFGGGAAVGAGGSMAGRVVNLSGARPVGAS